MFSNATRPKAVKQSIATLENEGVVINRKKIQMPPPFHYPKPKSLNAEEKRESKDPEKGKCVGVVS